MLQPGGLGDTGDPTRTWGPAEASGGKSEWDELGESLQGGDGNPGPCCRGTAGGNSGRAQCGQGAEGSVRPG